MANAHLLGLYHRICKLLFYKIKPVFVFDGAPPQLKRETLARRRMKRSKESKAAKVASEKILSNYIQRQAVAQKLNRQTHAVENALKGGSKVKVVAKATLEIALSVSLSVCKAISNQESSINFLLSMDFSHESTLLINQLSSSLDFPHQPTFLVNHFSSSINFPNQLTFLINQLMSTNFPNLSNF